MMLNIGIRSGSIELNNWKFKAIQSHFLPFVRTSVTTEYQVVGSEVTPELRLSQP